MNRSRFHSFQLGYKRGLAGRHPRGRHPFPFLLVRLQTLFDWLFTEKGYEVSIPFSQATNASPFLGGNASSGQFPFLLVRLQTLEMGPALCWPLRSFHSFQLGYKRSDRAALGPGETVFPFLLVRLQTDRAISSSFEISLFPFLLVRLQTQARGRRSFRFGAFPFLLVRLQTRRSAQRLSDSKCCFHSFQLGYKLVLRTITMWVPEQFPFLLVRLQTLVAQGDIALSTFSFHSFQLGYKHQKWGQLCAGP